MILFTLLVLAQDLAGLSSEGATAMRAKQYPAAVRAYQQLVEKDATNPMWRLNLGMALFYAADHSEKTVDQETCFWLFSHSPMGFRGRRTPDSNSPHPTTSKTRIIEKLRFHWFLVDQWDLEAGGPRIRTPHGRLPMPM